MSKLKTKSVSTRVPEDLKVDFMDLLEKQDKSFSKWLRSQMQRYLNAEEKKKSKKVKR